MTVLTGHPTSTWEYLVNKIGHTALLAWVLVHLAQLEPVRGALVAAVGYVVVGKGLWFARQRAFDAKDTAFDLVVCLLVAIAALPGRQGWLVALSFLAAWCLAIAAGSNNRWGKPS